jgi:hypothetical protein
MSAVASPTSSAPTGAPEDASEWASAHPALRRAAYDLRAESRARTIHAALRRLDLLAPSQTTLRIHVLGANFRESADPALAFAPLLALLEDCDVDRLELLLCGPNCCLEEPEADAAAKPSAPAPAAREPWWRSLFMGRLRTASPPPAPPAPAPPRVRLHVERSTQLYHEMDGAGRCDLAVAFNAGLWCYESWAPTVRVATAGAAPLLVTSYNETEAAADEEMLTRMDGVDWLWTRENNPDASPVAEDRVPGTTPQYENHVTQCVCGAAAGRATVARPDPKHAVWRAVPSLSSMVAKPKR